MAEFKKDSVVEFIKSIREKIVFDKSSENVLQLVSVDACLLKQCRCRYCSSSYKFAPDRLNYVQTQLCFQDILTQ